VAAPLEGVHHFKAMFFAMLPLSIGASLPVHINASFRLSSDRRTIRLDWNDNDESRFNSWLLKEGIPPLYFQLLEQIATRYRDNAGWWPGAPLDDRLTSEEDDDDDPTTAHEDALTNLIIDAFYSKLPQTTARIFCSKHCQDRLTFAEAVLDYSRSPPAVRKVLQLLQPPTLVRPSASVRKRMKGAGVQETSPAYIKKVLQNADGERKVQLALLEESPGIPDLLRYLGDEDHTILEGIRLLLLADDTWSSFRTDGPTRLYWPGEGERYVRDGLFPPDRFASQDIIPLDIALKLDKSPLKVVMLRAENVRSLVAERLANLEGRSRREWITNFWQRYRWFPQDELLESISDFPLVPGRRNVFKSLQQCKTDVLILDSPVDDMILECIEELGIPIISLDGLHANLREILESADFAQAGAFIVRFLLCARRNITAIANTISRWPNDRQEAFSEWICDSDNVRPCLYGAQSEKCLSTFNRLPVWKARRRNEEKYCPASQVQVLPHPLHNGVGRFCTSFVIQDPRLLALPKKSELKITELFDIVDLPESLQQGQDEDCLPLLIILLSSHHLKQRVQVPNSQRMFVSPTSLYERTPFFEAAFGANAPQFMLRPLESVLGRSIPEHGQNMERDVNMDIFVRCAAALHDDPLIDKRARGDVVFEFFRETLPLSIPSNQSHRLTELDGIRFIPRRADVDRELHGIRIPLPRTILDLPDLVAPTEIVREEFYPMAWTQRVRAAVQVPERLLLVFPKFGMPSGRVIVSYLSYSVSVTQV